MQAGAVNASCAGGEVRAASALGWAVDTGGAVGNGSGWAVQDTVAVPE